MEDFRIRQASHDDVGFVVGLAPRFGETRAAWRTGDEVSSGTARELERALRVPRDDAALLIAEDACGTRAGFVYVVMAADFFTGEPVAHVSEITVAQDGTGAGTALMNAAEDWARGRGARYVSLHVNAANDRARVFYERLGYDLEWHRLNKRLRP